MRKEKPLDARCSNVRVRANWLWFFAAVAAVAAVAAAAVPAPVAPVAAAMAALSSTARAPIASSTLVSGVSNTPGATAASARLPSPMPSRSKDSSMAARARFSPVM